MKKPLKERLADGLTVVAAKTYGAVVDTGRAFTTPPPKEDRYLEDVPVWDAQNKFVRTLMDREKNLLDRTIAIIGLAACERELRRRNKKRVAGEDP